MISREGGSEGEGSMLITEQEKFLGGNMTRGLSKPATRQQRESWVREHMELLHSDS